MSVEEITQQIITLPPDQQDRIVALLFRHRHANDREYHSEISRRLDDKDPSHWLTPDQFEKELDRKASAE
jgi:hypothetical protein